ncbi:MAG: HDOD domain-containing protein [Deltaproteobacteria bacterium]|nr:HDOD domain-containing protein [Deltaproteobacteria bacterium]
MSNRIERSTEASVAISPEIIKHSEEQVTLFFNLNDLKHPAVGKLYQLAVMKIARALADGIVINNFNPKAIEEYVPLAALTKQEDLEIPSLSRLLTDIIQLSTFPAVYFRIVQVLKSKYSSSGQLADEVSQDTNLAAQLLKVVNSPYYGFTSKVDSIKKAITLLGTNEILTLALGLTIISQFKDIPPELMDMRAFWKHSLTCGLFARQLAKARRMDGQERFFVAGMLHDLGRLILFKKIPQACTRAMVMSFNAPASMSDAEKAVMGYDHAAVGGMLLKQWKIPDSLVDMVRFHHAPQNAQDPLAAGLMHLADIMAIVLGIGDISMELVPTLNDDTWRLIGLSPEAVSLTVPLVQNQIDRTLEAFPV